MGLGVGWGSMKRILSLLALLASCLVLVAQTNTPIVEQITILSVDKQFGAGYLCSIDVGGDVKSIVLALPPRTLHYIQRRDAYERATRSLDAASSQASANAAAAVAGTSYGTISGPAAWVDAKMANRQAAAAYQARVEVQIKHYEQVKAQEQAWLRTNVHSAMIWAVQIVPSKYSGFLTFQCLPNYVPPRKAKVPAPGTRNVGLPK